MRRYNKSEILYVCPECGNITTPGKFAREPIKCSQPNCGGFATIRKCPYCTEILPQSMIETPNLPFSIVGVASSGKSNYITVMLNELMRNSGLELSLSPANQITRDIQRNNSTIIYERHTPVPGTEAGANTPQIWTIKNIMKSKRNSVPTYTFTIYDGAGEDYENRLDTSSIVCRYLETSKALLIVLDPLILDNVRKFIAPDIRKASLDGNEGYGKDSSYVVNRLADYIKSAWGIKTGKLLTIPTAIILTKFDMLLNHRDFAPDALIKKTSLAIDNSKQINTTEFNQIDEEIRNWLYAIGEGNFINAVSSNFSDYLFFGVSSFGCAPDAKRHLRNVKPHRVLDPIMWLFSKAGFID